MKIKLPIKNNPQKILEDVERKIRSEGGLFGGNLQNGEFSVIGVNGNYSIVNQELIITIKSKPFFIPEKLIEEEIKRYFSLNVSNFCLGIISSGYAYC